MESIVNYADNYNYYNENIIISDWLRVHCSNDFRVFLKKSKKKKNIEDKQLP